MQGTSLTKKNFQKQVPIKINPILEELRKLNTDYLKEYSKLEEAINFLINKYNLTYEAAIYELSKISGTIDSGLPFAGSILYSESKEVREKVYEGVFALKKLKELTERFDNLVKHIDDKYLSDEKIAEARASAEFLTACFNFISYKDLVLPIFEKGSKIGYERAKYGFSSADLTEQNFAKQPELKEEKLIPLPRTLADIYISGGSQIYFSPEHGIIGTKEQIELAKKAEAHEPISGGEETLLYLIPLIGSGYATLRDLKFIKEGSDEKRYELLGVKLSDRDIGKAMLVLDVVFLGFDTQFIIHLGSRSIVKAAARVGESGTRKIITTPMEKEVIAKVASEVDDKTMKEFLEICGKKRCDIVSKELIKKAGGIEKITKEIIKDYIKENAKMRKIGIIKRGSLVFKSGFREYSKLVFFDELVRSIDFESLRFLAQTAPKDKKKAYEVIYAALSTLDKKVQRELTEYVSKNGWEKLLKAIGKKSVSEGLQELFPSYKFAYKYAALEEWVKTGMQLVGLHGVFAFMQTLSEYLSEKKEERAEELKKEIETLAEILSPVVSPNVQTNIKDFFIKNLENKENTNK